MTTLTDELWAWLYPSIQDLKQAWRDDPEASWESRRRELVEKLGLFDPAEHPVVLELCRRLDDLPDEEREVVLVSDELDALAYEVIEVHSASVADDAGQAAAGSSPNAVDESWNRFLDENLSAWNGTEESWQQFTAWFLYQAGEAGVGAPARELVAYLDVLPVSERVGAIAEYGVAVPASQAGTGAEQPSEFDPAPAGSIELDPDAESILAEVLDEHPELADIGEDRARELMAEVLMEAETGEDEEDAS